MRGQSMNIGKHTFFWRGALAALPLTLLLGCGDAATPITVGDVAEAAARQQDRVAVGDLASWLVEGRADFQLVDVRTPDAYQLGAIESARNMPLATLFDEASLASLPRDRKVIVYADDCLDSTKAAVLLRLHGINAHMLEGGYQLWHASVLNPDIPAEALAGESSEVALQRAYACHFVGDRSGVAAAPESDAPFVPPVYVEPEPGEEAALPPPPVEEGC